MNNNNHISDLGKNITKYREQKKISINELKKLADIGYATLYDIEKGNKQNLSLQVIEKLAHALEVKTNDLLGLDTTEFVVADIEETLEIILESEELKLDEIELTKKEIEELNYLFKFGIESIRRRRKSDN